MYTHLPILGSVYRALKKRGAPAAQLGFLLRAASAHFGLVSSMNVARGVDHLLYPSFKKQPVGRPVFVVATPRSGTTFLHHLLALDEKNFTHFKLHQTVFPSLTLQQAFGAIGSSQSLAARPFHKLVDAMNSRLFPEWDGIHRVGLQAEEEDEALFVMSLLSPALLLAWPHPEDLPEVIDVDSLPKAVLTKMSRDYTGTFRRHLYGNGLNSDGRIRHALVKNVLLPSRLETVGETFPEARFIRLIRPPEEAIPSAVSLFFATWKKFNPQIDPKGDDVRALARMFMGHSKKIADFATREDDRVLTVQFKELIKEPEATLERIYDFLGEDFDEAQREKITAALSAPEKFKSRHKYSLETFGLTEEDLFADEEFGDALRDIAAECGAPKERKLAS